MIIGPQDPLLEMMERKNALDMPAWFVRQGSGTMTQTLIEVAHEITGWDWAFIGFNYPDATFFPAASGAADLKVANAIHSALLERDFGMMNVDNAWHLLDRQPVDTSGIDLTRGLVAIPLDFRDRPIGFVAIGNAAPGQLDPGKLEQIHLLVLLIEEIMRLRGELRFLALDVMDLIRSQIDMNGNALVPAVEPRQGD